MLANKRLCSSPNVIGNSTIHIKQGGSTRNRRRVSICFSFGLLKSSTHHHSPARLLWRLGAQVARALRFVSMRRKSSRRVSSSASLARSRSLVDAVDSQRAEAVEDCIEFLNSSSSFQRSNSVPALSSM